MMTTTTSSLSAAPAHDAPVRRGPGPVPGQRHAVVMGAGFGGIAAALRLRARGMKVTLVDRLDQLGGRARVFRRDGYTFDAGPTVITAPFLFDELFALFGKRAEDYFSLVPVEPWYRVQFPDGEVFDYGGTIESTLEQIRRFEPRDCDGYLRMLKACEKIYEIGFEQLGDQPFDTPATMLRALPDMARLRVFRSTYRFAAAHLRNERLRRVFSFQPLLVGGSPFSTSCIYSLIQVLERRYGVHYAMGGTGALVRGLQRLLEEVGVDIELNATVSRITTTGRRVTGVELEGGRRIAADLVVSNGDPSFVYQELLPSDGPSRRSAAKSRRMKHSMGLFVMYFGARRQYPDLAHHTILLSDRYRGLIRDIFSDGDLPPDPSLYVHAPTRSDPDMAPEGREAFYVLAPVPNLRSSVDWERDGDRFRDLVLDRIEREMAPGLRDHLEADFFVTPEYFQKELLSVHGAGFGVQPILRQSAYFRYHSRCPHYQGMYFVGSGTHPGAGIPGVIMSARTLERTLEKEGVV